VPAVASSAPPKVASPSSYKGLLSLAHRLADASAAAIMPHFRKALAIENKAGGTHFDPVTVADKAGEHAMRRLLEEEAPDHGVVGEEHGGRDGAGRYTWVLDPIDGTRGFMTGTPMWGTLIGLLDRGEPLLGLMNQPFTGERIWADRSSASWRLADGRARRIKVRPCGSLREAVLMCTTPEMFGEGEELDRFENVRRAVRMSRFGTDCYGYCLLAAGHVDIVVEANLKPYDVVALIPIITRAGGIITTWDGRPAAQGGRIVAAGDPKVHAAALRLLSGK
jgi:myo-inositol-1(or 4)-monophosphatase